MAPADTLAYVGLAARLTRGVGTGRARRRMSIRLKQTVLAVSVAAVLAASLTAGEAIAQTKDGLSDRAGDQRTGAVIPEGYAFVDGQGDGNYDRLVFPPGAMTAATLLVHEESYSSGSFRSYDFNPDTSKLYGVLDDDTYTVLALFDQDHNGRIATVVGPMPLHAANHLWVDVTIDPVSGAAYAASVSTSGPVETTVYRLDLGTGATAELATTPGVRLADMSLNCQGQLFGIETVSDQLVRVDPATGAVAAVGSLGVAVPDYFGGMDFDNDTGVLHAWLYLGSGTTRYSNIDLATGRATTFPGGTVPGAYEGAISNGCASPACPKLEKKVKKAAKDVKAAKRALKAAKQHGSDAAVKKAKKKLKKANDKLDKAEDAAEDGNCS